MKQINSTADSLWVVPANNANKISVVTHGQKLLRVEDVKTLMFWTAQMTKGLLDSGRSEIDIADQIEIKYKTLIGDL